MTPKERPLVYTGPLCFDQDDKRLFILGGDIVEVRLLLQKSWNFCKYSTGIWEL